MLIFFSVKISRDIIVIYMYVSEISDKFSPPPTTFNFLPTVHKMANFNNFCLCEQIITQLSDNRAPVLQMSIQQLVSFCLVRDWFSKVLIYPTMHRNWHSFGERQHGQCWTWLRAKGGAWRDKGQDYLLGRQCSWKIQVSASLKWYFGRAFIHEKGWSTFNCLHQFTILCVVWKYYAGWYSSLGKDGYKVFCCF